MRAHFWVILFFLSVVASAAHANCTLNNYPGTRQTGTIVYNQDYEVFQICRADGSWKALGKMLDTPTSCAPPWGGAVVGNGASITAYQAATVPFDETCVSESRTCNNGALSGSYTHQACSNSAQDTSPDAFAFTNATNVNLSTLTTSNIVQIIGITGPAPTSISGVGASYRICADAACASVVTDWTSAASTILKTQYIQVRTTSSASFSTAVSATMTVGSASAPAWSATTRGPNSCTLDGVTRAHLASATFYNATVADGCPSQSRTCSDGTYGGTASYQYASCNDTTPNAFNFTDLTGQNPSATVTSASLTINGIGPGTVPVSISGGSAQFSINGGGWTTSGNISNGQTLQLRLTSSASFTTGVSTTVTVGTVSDGWSVTTRAANSCTLAGVTRAHGLSATFYNATVADGCPSQSRTCNDGTYGGTASYQYASCNDTTPNSFNFTDQTNLEWNTLVTSNSLTINGIGPGTVPVSISGAGSPQFSINGGAWTTSGNISNGQTLQLRLTTANASNTLRTATVVVGTFSESWNARSITCSGNRHQGYCMYLGATNQSCTSVCSARGGVNTAGMNFAASTETRCTNALAVFGMPSAYGLTGCAASIKYIGCVTDGSFSIVCLDNPPTEGATSSWDRRVCACNN